MSKWGTSSLVLANFDELFAGATERSPSWLWQKATLVPETAGYVLVAPAHPSNIQPEGGAWFAPDSVIVPAQVSDRLCHDLLADTAAWQQLTSALMGRRIVPWAQVFSPGVETVIEKLLAAGIDIDRTMLPRVSALTVRYWNTKIGGRDLLHGIAAVRRALPAAVTCNTLVEVATFIAETEPNRGLVVKADRAAGGVGVHFFPPGAPRTIEQIATPIADSRSGTQRRKGKSMDDIVGPYLIEEMIGTPGANRSPTLDYLIADHDSVEFIGAGEQRLADGLRYTGAHFSLGYLDDRLEECIALGSAVGIELSRRGYRGFANLDFVIDPTGLVYISEINVRQSAPLDQFLIMRRLFGVDWPRHHGFACFEDAPLLSSEETNRAITRMINLPKDGAHHDMRWLRTCEDIEGGYASVLCAVAGQLQRILPTQADGLEGVGSQ